ncbi:MAG: RluA family pseudouridine synthase [Oscillospiraceae bacterium]|nr:RluA family pseudouridine synthase [Oscillospiraceae bacterium]
MRTFEIHENDAGQRADKFLLKACPALPKSLLYKAFRKRDIKCNGTRISAETVLSAGDALTVYLPDDCFGERPRAVAAAEMPEIAFEDRNIVLLKKPVNLPVHADDRGSTDTLQSRFLYYLTQTGAYHPEAEQSFVPALCNRLDRNTEGFVIGAKNAAALRCMNEKIRLGEITKQYLCITAGLPPRDADTVTAYHRRLPGQKAEIRRTPAAGFSEIRTGYEVLARHDGTALLLVTLYTGKTHQIRAQTAALGCPVLGDAKYGNIEQNRKFRAQHQLLAACRLRFDFSPEPCVLDALRGRQFSYQPDFCAAYGFFL